jgi:epidermal growth factor receptor substrate 15
MKYIKSILLFSLISLSVYGQKQATITTAFVVEKDIDVGLAGVTAKLFETGKEISSTVTNADGVVSFKLVPNSDYIIELSKQGYVSKIININTKIPDYEKNQFEVAFSILLFIPCEGLDYSVLQNPVVKITYDDLKRDFFNDKVYSNTMNAKLQQLMEANDKCIEDKYQAIVKKADRLFAEKKYQEAKDVYKQAIAQRPDDKYVIKQIEEIDRILAEKKDSEKAYND